MNGLIKKYLIHYTMLQFYARHEMTVDKVHEIISFKQSKCLGKYICSNTQKRNKAKNKFEKDFFKIVNKRFFGKKLENVRNRLKKEIIKNCENDKIIKQQTKITCNGIHVSYTVYSGYTFKQMK